MRRFLVLTAIAVLAAGSAVADEAVLIDFTKLVPDILPDEGGTPQQNKQTLMDFSVHAGTNYTDDQKALMKTSLAIPRWKVTLAQSSQTVVNTGLSYTKVASSKQFTNVLGARVHFPEAAYNSWAAIKPPFDIPAYEYAQVDDQGNISAPAEPPNFNTTKSRFEDGFGVVKNVGAIKSIAVEVYGLNFPCTLYLTYKDGSGEEKEINLGQLNFDGWAQLQWNNPQYIQDVRNRAIRLYPIYPTDAPYIRFVGFRVARDAADYSIVGNDFVAYFKEVRVIFDKAELIEDRDIDDENVWNIISDREEERKKWETKDFGKDEVLRYIEKEKQAPETNFTDPMTGQTPGGAAPAAAAPAPAAAQQ